VTLEEFYTLGDQYRSKLSVFSAEIYVCSGSSCLIQGADSLARAFEDTCEKFHITADVRVVGTGCMGLCGSGPLVRISPNEELYTQVQADEVEGIVLSHIVNHSPVAERVFPKDAAFFNKQQRVVLGQLGSVDPFSIEDYIARGGYQALAKAVCYHTTEGVSAEIRKSRLRGRSGSGEYAGLKWEIVRRASSSKKYVVCDANEGDPGTYLDRTILEGNPHLVLEAMAIAAYAVGASQGIIYARGDYTLAIARLRHAIDQAERTRILGNRIFGTGFNFRIDLRTGSGDYVCMDETALIASIEGKRAEARPRPPHPLLNGLWGKPTLIHNVETFSNIPLIMSKGARWFLNIGTENSKGTKIFALSGMVKNHGIVEVPMGTSFREVVEDIGGGVKNDGLLKAVHTGGPMGGCIPEKQLDLPVDYEAVSQAGATIGAGGLLVIDGATSMLDLTRHFVDFSSNESCGKCAPCRIGTVHLSRLLKKLYSREANPEDLDQLEELSALIKETSLCRLGQNAPNPIVSSLHYFRDEFEALLVDH
jgi:NADH:ubiquinone oxidoreductase subunit F (NADH-binding)/(2Fe-2S) ferredoxin